MSNGFEHKVGVLFIHGIGRQRRGETLTAWGEPLIQWISRWAGFTPAVEKKSSRERAKLKNYAADADVADIQDADEDRPAHARVTVTPTEPGQGGKNSSWLFCESWWAHAFQSPSFGELLHWGILIVPWTLGSHFGKRFRRGWNGIKKSKGLKAIALAAAYFVWGSFLLVASTLLSMLVVALMFLLALLAFILIPFPSIREGVLRVQQGLAGTIGDSFILLSGRIRRAAIISRIRRDFDWLQRKCERVAIVAHSQGACIAHLALRQGIPARFREKGLLLITFGSGLGKLVSLQDAQEKYSEGTGWLPVLGCLIASIPILKLFGVLPHWLPVTTFWSLEAGAFGILLLVKGWYDYFRAESFTDDDFSPAKQFGGNVLWKDYFASSDPVPNGSLFDEDQTPSYLAGNSIQVYNEASALSDHTSYWRNQVFVSGVASAIGALGDLSLEVINPEDSRRLEAAKARSEWRAKCLQGARLTALFAAIVLPLRLWQQLPILGNPVKAWLSQSSTRIPFLGEDNPKRILAADPAWSGAILLIGGVLLAYLLIYGCWRWWQHSDQKCCFARKSYSSLPFQFAFIQMISGILLGVSILVLAGWVDLKFFSVRSQAFSAIHELNEIASVPMFMSILWYWLIKRELKHGLLKFGMKVASVTALCWVSLGSLLRESVPDYSRAKGPVMAAVFAIGCLAIYLVSRITSHFQAHLKKHEVPALA